jgi:hypothetical protein
MPWEVRWFDNNLSKYDLALDWFNSIDNKFVREKPREDRYIFLRNSEDIGIKLRSSNYKNEKKFHLWFEIKWRKNIKPNFHVRDRHIYGNLEEWIKWSWVFSDTPVSTDNNTVNFFSTNNGPIIKIKKLRFLRRYIIQENAYESIESPDTSIEEGLQCEITKIIKDNTTWWSIGFESIGKKNEELSFCNTVQKILKEFRLKLEREDSYGYPGWIRSAANTF